jgi:hypothetical protein
MAVRRARHAGPGPHGQPWPSRRRVLVAAAVFVLVLGSALFGLRSLPEGPGPHRAGPPPPAGCSPCTVTAQLVPSCGVWWGATANPLGGESWDSALGALETTIGRTVDIAHYYHASPELFPTSEQIARAREPGKNRILLLNWKPEMGRTWAEVAAGDAVVDAAIDAEAAHLRRNFTDKFFLVVHHEPEEEVRPAGGSGYTAADYAAMYRHVVQRLRAGGGTNAVTVMNYMGTPHWGAQPWFADLYPGDAVVDWIAEDPYLFGEWSGHFRSAVNRLAAEHPHWPGFYTWATTAHPGKPIMLAEWGIDARLGQAHKTRLIRSVPAALVRFPAVKALVYWNAGDVHSVGVTRIDSSPGELRAYREVGMAPPLRRRGCSPVSE